MSYYKYNYENTKEGEEVRDTERQETFLYTWPSYGVIKFLAEQKKLNGSWRLVCNMVELKTTAFYSPRLKTYGPTQNRGSNLKVNNYGSNLF